LTMAFINRSDRSFEAFDRIYTRMKFKT